MRAARKAEVALPAVEMCATEEIPDPELTWLAAWVANGWQTFRAAVDGGLLLEHAADATLAVIVIPASDRPADSDHLMGRIVISGWSSVAAEHPIWTSLLAVHPGLQSRPERR